jgi:uncharacterized protein YciW
VLRYFNLPPPPTEDNQAIRLETKKRVKEWALKKMATQFLTFKKRLYTKYIKKVITLEFTGPLEKIRNHWEEFVEYKTLAEALTMSETNKRNSSKKKYHHKLAPGGYKTAAPK